ncbi:signal recognition particle-docking protein FtsY [Pseudomonas sp. J452]|uniref:signal recognition particle-docking protein FtsY n=1 Tax=Pseudomonas sp. J452 TaxID=2898441 RepID=UPI0021ADECBD|nr:signal recognition particle-docking protein FtsY [Pseudomonas sp. J452]UUY09148.1 signal recognition particle-docking protein FtsY [Pseudomonas sp. J452]
MFGSNDDKQSPAPAGKAPAEAGEKKSLFGWLRKKPQDELTPAAPSATTPETTAPAVPVDVTNAATAPVVEPVAPPVPAEATAAPVAVAAVESPVAAPLVEPVAAPVAVEVAAVPPVAPVELPSVIPRFEPVAAPAPVEAVPAPVTEVPASIVSEPSVATAAPVAPVSTPVAVAVAVAAAAAAAAPAPGEPAKPAFSRFRINAGAEVTHAVHEPVAEVVLPVEPEPAPQLEQNKPGDNQGGWFARLKEGLSKTSASLGEGMASLFLGKKAIDDDLLDELETRLLMADVGVEATTAIVQSLTKRVARKELADSDALYKALQEELAGLLAPVEKPLLVDSSKQPYVILVVGVNGVGKTTTIGKLAKKLQGEGKKVMLAAGDTFRAAAVEQLQVWGERNQIAVIAQHTGADSASVIFDAVQAAKARGIDVLIADTAGRLHTKDNLMEELKKVGRVIGKLDDTAPHEVLLVLDAGTGQNAINQTKQFHQTVPLTGLALTKLDGTAKGGVIFALAKQFGLPIRYIGVGEGIDDLRTFVAQDFVQALFAEKERA